MKEYAVLYLDELHIALPLPVVECVVRAVYVNPLPGAPDIVLGIVNIRGRIIPVVNMRRRFRLQDRPVALTDRIVIAHTVHRPVALVADAVGGILEYPEPALADAGNIFPGLEYIDGVMKLDQGMILIHDLNRFLSLDEEFVLEQAMLPAGGQ